MRTIGFVFATATTDMAWTDGVELACARCVDVFDGFCETRDAELGVCADGDASSGARRDEPGVRRGVAKGVRT